MIKVTSKYAAEPGLGPRSLQELLPGKQEVSVDPVGSNLGSLPGDPLPGETHSTPLCLIGVRGPLHGGWLTQISLNLSSSS